MGKKKASPNKTVVRTYATLVVEGNSISSEHISSMLGLVPTHYWNKGEKGILNRVRRTTCWKYSTNKKIRSRETAVHIGHLLTILEKKKRIVKRLIGSGCDVSIAVFWGVDGYLGIGGGPILDVSIMSRAVKLNLDIWFDFYYRDREGD